MRDARGGPLVLLFSDDLDASIEQASAQVDVVVNGPTMTFRAVAGSPSLIPAAFVRMFGQNES